MLHLLENNFLKVTASNYGGELHNILGKKNNTEFLWNGNPDFWKYHAPILFPIVGKVKNGKYTIDNTTYELPQHGLARINEFNLLDKSDTKISFELQYNESTLQIYPYKFSLIISYELIENTIKVSYIVKNLDDKSIYFSIGAHPAFMCPINENESITDYFFEFSKKETADLITVDMSAGLISHNTIPYLKDENIINIKDDLFKNDALIFHNLDSEIVSLKSKNHSTSISMDFSDFPYIALWSMQNGAPFVCIEPWFGHSDFVDFDDDFKNKPGVKKLEINNEFICSYTLIINE